MEAWIDHLAEALGEEPLTADETGRLLRAAREVAHRVERRITPLSTFLIGLTVGRALGAGHPRDEALSVAIGAAESLLPEPGENETSGRGNP